MSMGPPEPPPMGGMSFPGPVSPPMPGVPRGTPGHGAPPDPSLVATLPEELLDWGRSVLTTLTSIHDTLSSVDEHLAQQTHALTLLAREAETAKRHRTKP